MVVNGMEEIIYGREILTSSKLLPCPFCGGKAVIQRDVRYPRPECNPKQAWEVFCQNLECCAFNADNAYFLSEEAAISAWNCRA